MIIPVEISLLTVTLIVVSLVLATSIAVILIPVILIIIAPIVVVLIVIVLIITVILIVVILVIVTWVVPASAWARPVSSPSVGMEVHLAHFPVEVPVAASHEVHTFNYCPVRVHQENRVVVFVRRLFQV